MTSGRAIIVALGAVATGALGIFSCVSDSESTPVIIADGGVIYIEAAPFDAPQASPTDGSAAIPPDGGAVDASSLYDRCPDGGLRCLLVQCADGGTTSLVGTLYDPSGTVPLPNAVVYVDNAPPSPLPDGATCTDACGGNTIAPLSASITDADGNFTLNNVPVGSNIPFIVQDGRWRRQIVVDTVTACTANAAGAAFRLPRSAAEGDLPHIAIATGSNDPIECLLARLGLSPQEFSGPSGTGHIHIYRYNGLDMAVPVPDAGALWSDLPTLLKYDQVILPCAGNTFGADAGVVQNLNAYADQGGRLFITHYGGYDYINAPSSEWGANVAEWYDPSVDPENDTGYGAIATTNPKGQVLEQWLSSQLALGTSGAPAGDLYLVQPRYNAKTVPSTVTPLVTSSTPIVAVEEFTVGTPITAAPQDQCGRLTFSSFHTSTESSFMTDGGVFPSICSSAPFSPQEKALIYTLFDSSICIAPPPPP